MNPLPESSVIMKPSAVDLNSLSCFSLWAAILNSAAEAADK